MVDADDVAAGEIVLLAENDGQAAAGGFARDAAAVDAAADDGKIKHLIRHDFAGLP